MTLDSSNGSSIVHLPSSHLIPNLVGDQGIYNKDQNSVTRLPLSQITMKKSCSNYRNLENRSLYRTAADEKCRQDANSSRLLITQGANRCQTHT